MSAKRERVVARLRTEPGQVAVAFSGGVDSTLLLALALEALGSERVVAVTAVSESLPASERAACERLAASLGVAHEIVRTHELEREGYRANAGDRCYHCKSELFAVVSEALRGRRVAYGANLDDLSDYRPGWRAALEAEAFAPLVEAELGKDEVRELARGLGLPNWDKPAHPCLASRIPHGEPVDPLKLSMIEAAEARVRAAGVSDLRVRHHELVGPAGRLHLARIEVASDERALIVAARALAADLRELGYAFVTLDLEGFRSGRLNDVLPAASAPRGAARPLPVRS